MKSINNFILESKSDKYLDIAGEYIVNLYHHSDLLKDKISKMLMEVSSETDMSLLKSINNYIIKTDKVNSLPYTCIDDEFLSKENYNKIIDKLSQYIEKFISKV